jgi:UDP-N-acetylmuramate--alanine ligase
MGLLRPGVHVHLVGIGGIGLSAIARVLHGWGYTVSGSDMQPSALLDELVAEGITAYPSHRAQQVAGAQIVVVSSAIPEDNPEVREARRRGLEVVKREQFLSELTEGKLTIAVAGTHGKTTTSAMISWILTQAALEPTFVVGGLLQNLGTNARAGSGPHFVIEADEYDRAFLGLNPDLSVIASLEHDHPDCYPTLEAMRAAFHEFAGRLVEGGLLIVCGEDREGNELGVHLQAQGHRVETYGLGTEWDWWAQGVELGNSAAFEVWHRGKQLGTCALQMPGRHNVLNALAALAACHEVGVEFGLAAAALTRFQGTARRFEVKGQVGGVTVVDDYAHHPTEIEATLAAARLKYPGRAIWAVFQPHTYSRTAIMLEGFAAALGDADHVVVTEIYAAREENTLGVSGSDLVHLMPHPDACYVATLEDAATTVLERVQTGDVVITLGAGDGYLVGEQVLEELRQRREGSLVPSFTMQQRNLGAARNSHRADMDGILMGRRNGDREEGQ